MRETDLKNGGTVHRPASHQPGIVPRNARRRPPGKPAVGISGAGKSPVLRCAVYTRKSSEEGLEQDFNSLQAQREACEAYIASQRHEGWQVIPQAYDDGGYSGGSMERPGLKALLSDIAAGRIDVVVVYKVDRLTRSLTDFVRIVERFDARSVSFVSVTQSFNTTSSMGRLTLNVLLSFAQFEREVTAERIRDKIAASKKKGIFMGGPVPLGYRIENRKLVIDEEEAQTVRLIFATYLKTRSTIATANELKRMGIRTRIRQRSDGSHIGGIPFTYGPLQALLRNRVYIGEITHKGQHYPGEHAPLLEKTTFDAAQQLLTTQRSSPERTSHTLTSLLTGKIFDAKGNRMAPSHTNKKGVRYRYYVSRALLDGEPERAGKPSRIAANEIELLVTNVLQQECIKQKKAEAWGATDKRFAPATVGRGSSTRGNTPSGTSVSLADVPVQPEALIEVLLDRVEVFDDRIAIFVQKHQDESQIEPEHAANDDGQHGASFKRIIVPCNLGYAPPVKQVKVSERGKGEPPLPNSQRRNRERLIMALYKARGWFDELASGKIESVDAIATREGKSARNISMMLNLAFLAPEIIEAILNEETPASLSASQLAQTLPLSWEGQRKLIASYA